MLEMEPVWSRMSDYLFYFAAIIIKCIDWIFTCFLFFLDMLYLIPSS